MAGGGGSGWGGSNGEAGRRQKQAQQWLRARAVMAGAGGGDANRGGGRSWWRRQRLWDTAVVAQVARSRELRWLGREEDEVNLKKPSPPSFYKLLGSRTVTWHISL